MTPPASVPVLGPLVPQSGGRLSRLFGRTVLRLMGWRIEGEIANLPRFVMIVAPHTSNWDFVVAVAAKFAMGLRANWLGKHTLFVFPFGPILRAIGGIPVDRRSSNDMVADMVSRFAVSDQLILGLAPEGTRKHVERWRTGFYHIAFGARVPIVCAALDWKTRSARIEPPFVPSGDVDAEVDFLRRRFEGTPGRRRASDARAMPA